MSRERDEMAAFDALPPRVRQRIAQSRFGLSALCIVKNARERAQEIGRADPLIEDYLTMISLHEQAGRQHEHKLQARQVFAR